MDVLVLKRGEDHRLRAGHLWVFSNEVAQPPGTAAAGDLVDVRAASGLSLGTAFYHPHSLISARLLGEGLEEADKEFFRRRIRAAAALRESLAPTPEACRLVHGESDRLPGLIVERFGTCLVIQTLCAAMDRRQEQIVDVLEEEFKPSVILERNDTGLRDYEDLPRRKGVLRGAWPGQWSVQESGVRYELDLLEGQKTGFFLDQKRNRMAAARYCKGRQVLDCFCNAGGFAFQAARAGAVRVVGVDASAYSVASANRNAGLNGLGTTVEFVESEVFRFLEALSARDHYGVIILDPPSFAPRKKDVSKARRAYLKLNRLAIRALESGGILVSASCSHHLLEEEFYRLVNDAAIREGRRLQLLERRGASPDHPVLPAMPETAYLKLGIFRVVGGFSSREGRRGEVAGGLLQGSRA